MPDNDQQPGPRTTPTWEYMTYTLIGANPHTPELDQALSNLGAQGWQMCGVQDRYIYFMRQTS
jgi:hypothetical protein